RKRRRNPGPGSGPRGRLPPHRRGVRMVGLLRLMLTEEFRVHTSYSGRSAFLAFPIIITGFSLAIAVTSERLFTYMPFWDAFLLGMSLSFFVSTVYMRSQMAFLISVGGITALFAAAGTTRSLPLSWILPGLAAHEHLPPFPTDAIAAVRPILAGLGIVVALVAAAVFLVPEQYEPRAVAAREALPRLVARLKRLGRYAPLLSKEFVDLQRSGT